MTNEILEELYQKADLTDIQPVCDANLRLLIINE